MSIRNGYQQAPYKHYLVDIYSKSILIKRIFIKFRVCYMKVIFSLCYPSLVGRIDLKSIIEGNSQECPLENVLDQTSPDFGPRKNILHCKWPW